MEKTNVYSLFAQKFFFMILLGVLAWAASGFLFHSLTVLADPYPVDYGEGAVLDQAIRLFHGEPIYRVGLETPPYVINVYPPLYLLIQLPFLKLFGVAFWYGRAISLLATLGTALFMGLILRRITGNWIAGIIAGLTFLSIPYTVHWASLFRIDTLALCLSWAALFVVVRWPKDGRALVGATLLLAASIYTRQSYLLAAPLAVFCWLWAQNGFKRAFTFAALLGAVLVGIFAALNTLTAGGFFFNTVTVLGKQTLSLDTISYFAEEITGRMPVLLTAAAMLTVTAFLKGAKQPLKPLILPYLLGAIISALTIGKPGSNVNYLLELAAALSVCAALFAVWLKRWSHLYMFGLLVLSIQVYTLAQWTQTDYFSSHYAEPHAESPQLMQLIHAAKGPVLTDEYIGLLLLDQRPVFIQPFDFAMLSRNGMWDQQPFLDTLKQRKYELIILCNPYGALVKQRWTRQMLQHIYDNYDLVQQLGDNEIYSRRP